jgi:hypothetical protein
MVVRNEHERLRYRFKNLEVLTASLGAYLAVAFALCNSLFVQVWTGGKITWLPQNDILLGLWFFTSALQVPHCGFVFVTKQIGGMRYLFFAEGCCFVALSLVWGYRWGLSGIILCSVLCVMFFSYPFGLRRSRQYFHASLFELAADWIRPSLKLVAVLSAAATGLWLATSNLPAIWRLAIHALVVGLGGGLLFLRLGLPVEVVREAETRLPRPAAWLLGKLVPCGL